MRNIRLPRLLDAGLRERARLHPTALSIHLTLLPPSTAEMALAPDDADVSIRDLIELYDASGSAGIFRVTAVETEPQGRIVHLTHALATLQDGLIGALSHTGTARRCMELILGYQGDIRWALGNCEVPDEVTVLFTAVKEDALSALLRLTDMLPGYGLYFGQSGPVWQLHLRALPEDDACEGRLSRNLENVRITVDSAGLCTRIYPYGALQDKAPISLTPLTGQDYLQSDAASAWGIISRSFTCTDILDAPTLQSVAAKYLDRHALPAVSIELNAFDLSERTGEDADRFLLGRMCRVPLPDMGFTLRERITAIHQPDVYGAPGQMTLTLGHRPLALREEIDALLREVRSAQLLGGTVTETVSQNRAEGTAAAPVVHYFTIEDPAALLSAQFAFEPDDGVFMTDVRIDDLYVPRDVWQPRSFPGTAYLKRDAQGLPTQGTHRFILYPSTGTAGQNAPVESAVTLQTVAAE